MPWSGPGPRRPLRKTFNPVPELHAAAIWDQVFHCEKHWPWLLSLYWRAYNTSCLDWSLRWELINKVLPQWRTTTANLPDGTSQSIFSGSPSNTNHGGAMWVLITFTGCPTLPASSQRGMIWRSNSLTAASSNTHTPQICAKKLIRS